MKTLTLFCCCLSISHFIFAQNAIDIEIAQLDSIVNSKVWSKEKIPFLKKKIALSESYNDSIHIETIFYLAYYTRRSGWMEESEPIFYKALNMQAELFGKETKNYAEILSQIGILYQTIGQHDKVEDIHKESLEIRAKVYSKASPEYAVGLNNLEYV
ncbi:MAG: tetratricopeptide repeat protein [Aureispira sp.]|nr:tetratricopeptide repeat protein [Aureispira sp.]